MSRIAEYLEAGRADKMYDPNQGLYVDPNTGKAFVPMFTDDPSQRGADMPQRVQQSMPGQQLDTSQGAYLVKDRPGPGAIPGPKDGQQGQAPDPRDPWAMAQAHTGSQKFMTEVYQQMFPGRDPSQGFDSPQEREQFSKALKSARNALVDRFKWQIDNKRKQETHERRGTAKRISNQELMKMISEEKDKLDQVNNDPNLLPEQRIEDTETKARENILNRLKGVQQEFGDLWDEEEGGGMPVVKDDRTAMPDQKKPATGAMPTDAATTGAGEGLGMEAPGVFNQESPGTSDFITISKSDPKKATNVLQNTIAEVQMLYPDMDPKEQLVKAQEIGRENISDIYMFDPEKFLERLRGKLDRGVETKKENIRSGAKEAVSEYRRGGSPALM
jgi:hypothetical protein